MRAFQGKPYQVLAEQLVVKDLHLILFGQFLTQADGLFPHLQEHKGENGERWHSSAVPLLKKGLVPSHAWLPRAVLQTSSYLVRVLTQSKPGTLSWYI